MRPEPQIQAYLDAQPEPKRSDLRALDAAIRALAPQAELWFLDGRDATGKVVSNPSVGYGTRTQTHADGSSRPFYRVGLSANTAGISVYLFGMPTKDHLAGTYGPDLGQATVTGYCIKFRNLKAIHLPVLLAAIREALARPA